jgi:hypothetical protein
VATFTLYALDGSGTAQLTSYNGTTTVQVLDASSSSGSTDVYGCNSAWVPAQTLGTSVVFIGGQATLVTTMLDAGLKEARIMVTDNATNAKGCSLDNFAIRPATLEVVASHATESTAGTAPAPVLAPKRPMSRPPVAGSLESQSIAPTSLLASRPMSKRRWRVWLSTLSSSAVRRSMRSVASRAR